MAKRRAYGSPHCCYCKRQLTPAQPERGTSFTFDHVKAVARGGWKRVPCCRACNALKGDLSVEDWFLFIGAWKRWWKQFQTPAQVLSAVLDLRRAEAYAKLAQGETR